MVPRLSADSDGHHTLLLMVSKLKRPAAAQKRPAASEKTLRVSKRQASDEFAEVIVRRYIKCLPAELATNLKKNLQDGNARLASACSGSGLAEAYHAILHKEFEADAVVLFTCEKARAKRTFIECIVSPQMKHKGCSFEDMLELPSGTGRCCVHGGKCRVPTGLRILIC